MSRLPCERSSQDLVPQVGRDVVRVHHIRSSRRSKCKKIFEYLVDELSTWITEDQLRISLSPTLLAGLKASSTDPSSPAESEVHPKHLALWSTTSTTMLQEPLEVTLLPLLHQARHGAAILMRGSGAGNGGTRTCMLRPVAKPIP
jgi:hypothetical protein